ncbi:Glutathione S-transferase N-terminal domain [Phytophthora infestans]|uniref:Glutathione S-transferase N-terminal domain n=1 Tax=Phytophthora infestans TaxID=4787 RepID=A0A833T2V4_PHYIN|nr:Glutathione S-transferase N-terminal domain [Phytophthora infestans]
MAKLELFSYWQSSCSWRVRIALAWKGIQYEYYPVHLRGVDGGEQRQNAFRILNPNQRVPVVLMDGRVIAQSGAILEYLEEAYSAKPLLSSDLFERAQVRNLAGIISCDTQPAQSMGLSAKVADLQSPASEEERQALVVAWNKHWIERGLRAQRARMQRDHPTISRIVGELEQLPAFVSSRPDKQPDAITEVDMI